jgi:hypothetical protein
MRLLLALVLATALGGCGGSRASPPSGGAAGADGAAGAADANASSADAAGAGGAPRLVPWQVQAEGSPPLVVGIYDAREKVHCRFLHDEAGQLRCLPWGLAPLTKTKMFSDPTCMQHVYQSDSTQGKIFPGRPVALPLPRLQCEPQRYAVGTLRVLPADATLYAGTPCAPIDAAVAAPTGGILDVGVEQTLPPDRWATGAEVDGPLVAGRIQIRQVATTDGTRFGDHLVDETFGKWCGLRPYGPDLSGEGPSCWPEFLIGGTDFEGADCTGTVRVWQSEACADPAGIATSGRRFALGPLWTGPVSFSAHGCNVVSDGTPDGPYAFYELGAPLADMTIAGAEWWSTGSGRFVMRGLRGAAGDTVLLDNEIAPPNGWIVPRYFDTIANVDCDPRWTPEGLVRCVPKNAIVGPGNGGLGDVFADAACQKSAFACPGFTGKPCGGAPVISTAVDANGETRAVSLNAAVDLTTVYRIMPDLSCVPEDGTMLAPYTFFTVGGPLPWDAYPAFTEINGRASGAP